MQRQGLNRDKPARLCNGAVLDYQGFGDCDVSPMSDAKLILLPPEAFSGPESLKPLPDGVVATTRAATYYVDRESRDKPSNLGRGGLGPQVPPSPTFNGVPLSVTAPRAICAHRPFSQTHAEAEPILYRSAPAPRGSSFPRCPSAGIRAGRSGCDRRRGSPRGRSS